MRKIKRNALHCKLCDETIESEDRHDFKWCFGGHFSVGGGLDHLKRGTASGVTLEDTEDRSEYELSHDAQLTSYLIFGKDAGQGWIFGIKLMKLRPDIAGRILASLDEISGQNPAIFEAGLRLAQADDELLSMVVGLFEKDASEERRA